MGWRLMEPLFLGTITTPTTLVLWQNTLDQATNNYDARIRGNKNVTCEFDAATEWLDRRTSHVRSLPYVLLQDINDKPLMKCLQ